MACRKTRQKLQHCQFLCLQQATTKPRNPLSDCGDIGGGREYFNWKAKR